MDLKKLADEICRDVGQKLEEIFNNPKQGLVYMPGHSMSMVPPGLATQVPCFVHKKILDIILEHLQRSHVELKEPPVEESITNNPFQTKFERVI